MSRARTITGLASCVLVLAACTSSGGAPSLTASSAPVASVAAPSTAAESPSAAGSDGGGSAASAPATATASGQGGSSAGATVALPANVCDILDPATIASATGLQVGGGKQIAAEQSSEVGGCLWSASTTEGVQVTAYHEEPFATRLRANRPGFDVVPGVGLLAKDTVATLPGTKTKVATLSTDMGTFGVLITVTSPTATTDQVVLLARALQ